MTNVDKIIEKKVEEVDLTEDELRDVYKKQKDRIDKKLPDKDEGFRERQAVRQMVQYASGLSRLDEKEVTIACKTEKRDTIARSRAAAKEIFEENPQKAIEDKYTNRQGEPLWRGGRNEGQTMPKHLWRQDCYGIDSEGDYVQVSATREELLSVMDSVEPFTTISGKFNDVSDFGDRVKEYRISSFTEIETVEDDVPVTDVLDALTNTDAFEDPYDLRDIAEKLEYPEVVVVLTMDWCEEEIPDNRNRRVRASTFDGEINTTVWIPDSLEVNYENGTEIYVLGTASLGEMYRDDLEERPLQLNAHTMIPNPEGTLNEGESLPSLV